MFEREHHRRVADVLESLDAGLLKASACLFGGGSSVMRPSSTISNLMSMPSTRTIVRRPY